MSKQSGAHTKGPWAVNRALNDSKSFPLRIEAEGVYVASVRPGADREANARLIAAAPDLLAACLVMIEWDDREKDHAVDFEARMDLCEASFAKARAAVAMVISTFTDDCQFGEEA